jgi:spore coat protein U-like protein
MAALAACALVPVDAWASCAACSCSASTNNLAFGTYNPSSSTPTRTTANVSVNCFSFLVLMFGTVDLSLSAGTAGVATTRTLANGTSRLNYNVYQDNANATIWGGGGVGGLLENLTISGLLSYTASRTAYGTIPARQWVKPGVYTDTLIVTVSY